MTEEAQSNPVLQTPGPPLPPELPNRDMLLAELVDVINQYDEGAELGIILMVGGTLVSGHLIPGKVFFKLYGEQIGPLFDPDGELKTAQTFAVRGKEIYTGSNPRVVGYVHLRDARIYTADRSPIPVEGLLWRGRITSIDAYSLGLLSADKPKR